MAPATLIPIFFCIFLPLRFSGSLCVSPSPCLFWVYLPLSVLPGGDIYQMSGQSPSLSTDLDLIFSGLSTVSRALGLRRVRATEGISYKTPSFSSSEDIWDAEAGEFPTGHFPLFFYLCIDLQSSQESKQWKRKWSYDYMTVNNWKHRVEITLWKEQLSQTVYVNNELY